MTIPRKESASLRFQPCTDRWFSVGGAWHASSSSPVHNSQLLVMSQSESRLDATGIQQLAHNIAQVAKETVVEFTGLQVGGRWTVPRGLKRVWGHRISWTRAESFQQAFQNGKEQIWYHHSNNAGDPRATETPVNTEKHNAGRFNGSHDQESRYLWKSSRSPECVWTCWDSRTRTRSTRNKRVPAGGTAVPHAEGVKYLLGDAA